MKELDAKKTSHRPVMMMAAFGAGIVAGAVILNFVTGGKFLTGANILFVLSASVVTAFVVLAFCFMFTVGIFDLSLGAIMILASNVGGILAVEWRLGYVGLIGGAVIVAVALETLNVKMMLVSKIPPWIFGLGMAMLYEAIGALYNSAQIKVGKQVVSLETVCRGLGNPPWNLIVLAVALAAAYVLFNRTSMGFSFRAVGSNSVVARMMGINTEKAIMLAALFTGIFAGFASAINESYGNRVGTGTGLTSVATIFTPLAGFLLAFALEKIFNIVVGAVISTIILTSLFNVLTLLGVPSGTWQAVIMGLSVLACGILSQRRFEGVVK